MTPRSQFATLAPAAVVATILAFSLSGCGMQLVDPDRSTPADTSGTPTASTAPTEVGGQFTTGDCDGRDVTLDQDGATVLLDGTCASVTISGDGIFATFENAESITVTGSDNNVAVDHVAATLTVDAASEGSFIEGQSAAKIIVAGNNASVVVTEVGLMTITGSDNFISWGLGATSATDTGTGNTVLPASGD